LNHSRLKRSLKAALLMLTRCLDRFKIMQKHLSDW
jgi:hypothetical protein